MKKFLFSLCAIAIASACVFMNSCKDEDELAIRVTPEFSSIKAIVDATEASTDYSYAFVVDGTTYDSYEAFQAAVAALDPGTYDVKVILLDEDGEQVEEADSQIVIPETGTATSHVQIPTAPGVVPTVDVTITTALESAHSGGAAN